MGPWGQTNGVIKENGIERVPPTVILADQVSWRSDQVAMDDEGRRDQQSLTTTGSVIPAQYHQHLNHSKQLLLQAHTELHRKNEQIQLLADENADLLTQLKAEKEARQRLETDFRQSNHNEAVLAAPGAEPNVPGLSIIDLRKEVKRARDELQEIYFENSRYRSEIQKLTAALEKVDEQNQLERSEWKLKAGQLLQQLQAEEDRARHAKKEAEKISEECIKLGSENLKLDQMLSQQEAKISTVLKELDETNQTVSKLTNENERIKNEAEEGRKNMESLKTDLDKCRDQLRMMSEKVLHLIQQLETMEKLKHQAQQDLQTASKKIAVLESRSEGLQKIIDKDNRIRKQMEYKLKSEKEKSSSFRLSGQEFRRKLLAEERIKGRMADLLKAKDKSMSEIMNKYKDAQWTLESQKGDRGVRQQRVEHMEVQLKNVLNFSNDLKLQIQKLKSQQSILVDTIRSKDVTIQQLQRKQSDYVEKIKNLIYLAKGGDEPLTEQEVDHLLNDPVHHVGSHIRYMLSELHINQPSFIKMTKYPTHLIEKIAQRFYRLYSRLQRRTGRKPIPNGLLKQNQVLFQRLFEVISGNVANSDVHVKTRQLNLSNLALTDEQFELVLDLLSHHNNFIVLDLSHNCIHDKPFIKIIQSICRPSCSIQVASFADNFVSQQAIQSVFAWIQGHEEVSIAYFRISRSNSKGTPTYSPQIVWRFGNRDIILDVANNDIPIRDLNKFVSSVYQRSNIAIDEALRIDVDRKINIVLSQYPLRNRQSSLDDNRKIENTIDSGGPAQPIERSVSPTLTMSLKNNMSTYLSTSSYHGSQPLIRSTGNFYKNSQEITAHKRLARAKSELARTGTKMPVLVGKSVGRQKPTRLQRIRSRSRVE